MQITFSRKLSQISPAYKMLTKNCDANHLYCHYMIYKLVIRVIQVLITKSNKYKYIFAPVELSDRDFICSAKNDSSY